MQASQTTLLVKYWIDESGPQLAMWRVHGKHSWSPSLHACLWWWEMNTVCGGSISAHWLTISNLSHAAFPTLAVCLKFPLALLMAGLTNGWSVGDCAPHCPKAASVSQEPSIQAVANNANDIGLIVQYGENEIVFIWVLYLFLLKLRRFEVFRNVGWRLEMMCCSVLPSLCLLYREKPSVSVCQTHTKLDTTIFYLWLQ